MYRAGTVCGVWCGRFVRGVWGVWGAVGVGGRHGESGDDADAADDVYVDGHGGGDRCQGEGVVDDDDRGDDE